MADKRMFNKQIIDSDAFLDMPLSSQALYFHLNMRADDDGFVNNPKKIQRMIMCSDGDLEMLFAKRFVIPFESGICVIKHWLIHNYIRKDTYKETVYTDEKSMLFTKENKTYTLEEPKKHELLQDSNEVVDETSRREDKNNKNKEDKDSKENIPYAEIIDCLNKKADKHYKPTIKKTKDLIKARFNDGFNFNDFELVITKKCAEWLGTDQEKYLRPETLFGNKFEGYLNQKGGNRSGFTKQNTKPVAAKEIRGEGEELAKRAIEKYGDKLQDFECEF